jgi:DNA repair and recombination protein RAD52
MVSVKMRAKVFILNIQPQLDTQLLLGIAIENAKKEAVSDARKRCLRVFGNALGNCIYDKEHIKKVSEGNI